MNKFNYHKINKSKKIRYLKYNQKNADYIVFLHGFMSDLEGKKPKAFLSFAKKNKHGFLALEYSGHGKSSGRFTNGNISKWTKETTLLIKKIVKKNRIILVGSSMGSWIALNQFKFFKKQIIGFLGIGSAPQFLESLMWNKFSKKMKKEITKNGIINLKHGNDQGRELYKKKLIRLTEQHRLTNQIKFIDHCDDMALAYKVSDIIVSASIEPEAFGRVAVEAQSMEKLIIASNIGGSNETINDEKTGFLFKSGDAESLSKKIIHGLTMDETSINLMGKKGRDNIIKKFNVEKMCFSTYSEYKRLLN